MTEPLIELRNVSKHFAGVKALTDVSIAVHPGEVVCLLGDNGAGKSTLIKILSGFHPPSSGSICPRRTGDALRRPARRAFARHRHRPPGGGNDSAHERGSQFLPRRGAEKGTPPFRWLDTERCNSIALEQIRKFGITRVRDGDQLVGTLSGGERQVIAIGRAMYFGAKVLILDEPTSALGVKEASTVLRFINHAKNQGVGVVFITHNAHHAMSAGDYFVVLIQGQVAARFRRGEKSSVEVLSLMAGGEQIEDVAGEFAHLGKNDAAARPAAQG